MFPRTQKHMKELPEGWGLAVGCHWDPFLGALGHGGGGEETGLGPILWVHVSSCGHAARVCAGTWSTASHFAGVATRHRCSY